MSINGKVIIGKLIISFFLFFVIYGSDNIIDLAIKSTEVIKMYQESNWQKIIQLTDFLDEYQNKENLVVIADLYSDRASAYLLLKDYDKLIILKL